MLRNAAFADLSASADLSSVLQRCLATPGLESVNLDDTRVWIQRHELEGGCCLLLFDRRGAGPPFWRRVAWPPRLSAREREICCLVLKGLENEAIAAHPHLSLHTVKNHLRHIHSKLGVGSRVALVLALLGLGDRRDGEGAPGISGDS